MTEARDRGQGQRPGTEVVVHTEVARCGLVGCQCDLNSHCAEQNNDLVQNNELEPCNQEHSNT